MLTWAMVFFFLRAKEYMPILFIAAIIGDCTMIYYVASAIAGRHLG